MVAWIAGPIQPKNKLGAQPSSTISALRIQSVANVAGGVRTIAAPSGGSATQIIFNTLR